MTEPKSPPVPIARKSSLVDIESESLPPELFYCPYLSCEHHKRGNGFTKRGSLDSHIQHSHRGIWRQANDDASVNENGTADGSSSEESDIPLHKPRCRSKWVPTGHRRYSEGKTTDDESVQYVERNKTLIDKDHLKQMEAMIKNLQRRVGQCERRQDSVSDSDESSRLDSIDSSMFDSRIKHVHEPRRPRRKHSEEIIVIDDDSRTVSPGPSGFRAPPPPLPFGPIVPSRGPNPPEVAIFGPPADGNHGPKVQIMRWKQCSTNYGDPEWHMDNESHVGPSVQDLSNKCLLTVIREFDRHKQFWRRRIQIASPVVIAALKNLNLYDVDIDSQDGQNGDELRLIEPLMVLFHNRRQLHEQAQMASLEDREQFHLVLNFMLNEFVDVSQRLNDIECSYPSGFINYADIWLLYTPGTIVYSRETGEYEAFVVHSLRGMQRRQKSIHGRYSHSRLDLTCWSINYDGEIFGRVWSIHTIAPFQGTKAINSLDLVPEKFLPEGPKVKSDLIARGKKFWSLQGQKYQDYSGEMYSQHGGDEAVRVMVDHLTYQRRSNWPISIDRKRGPIDAQSKNWQDDRFSRRDRWGSNRRRGRYPRPVSPIYVREDRYTREYSPDRIDDREEQRYPDPYRRYDVDRPAYQIEEFIKYDIIKADTTPDDFAALLCPQHVHGYCLRDKVWKELNVTQLRPVAFRKNAWNRLVLDKEYKDIVQAMVSSYVEKTAMLDDLVAGKGAGLVALLHGPPGSGKTLTAECVADSFEKPLYHISCGDIGTDPERLEERLEEVFDYAETWGAVLLLDEADIFLQDRDYANLERNALVSIFLRSLEYFNGVLFLTTNRVGIFDQAFQSRVHVSLGLPSLDQQRRVSVWAIFLQDLAAKGAISDTRLKTLTRAVDDKWSKEKLNGRQIRNAVRTALVVAEKKGEMVGEKEFETVLKIGREFEGYMGMLGKGEANLEGFQEV